MSSTPGARRSIPVERQLPVAVRLAIALSALTLISTLFLLLPGVANRRLGFTEAMFTAVSALTVTGLSTLTPASDLTTAGKVLLITLVQIGGFGMMSFVVIIFRLIGRHISVLDRITLRSALGGVETRGVLRLVARVLLGVVLFEAAGAALLFFHWRPMFSSDGEALGYAVFHAISAFCNAGFELFTGSTRFADGLPSDGLSMAILSALIIIGGLGVPVIANLMAYPRERRLSLHTRMTLAIVFFLVLLGGMGIFTAEMLSGSGGGGTQAGWTRALPVAFFHSVMARSAGFSVEGGFASLSPASQFLTLLLMFIGAAPASMGGGITTGTAAVLAIAMVSYVRNRFEPTVAGRAIPAELVRRAMAVLIIAILVVAVATWLLLVSHPQTGLLAALFEVVSAFSTCGLSLAFTNRLNGFGMAIIMLVMFWGRLGALTVVVALTRRTTPPLVRFPEENILIG